MSFPELSRSDQGPDVIRLQTVLNRVGAMLRADGDFGPMTDRGVRHAQEIAGRPADGVVDEDLWRWLDEQPEPYPPLHTNGVAFIAGHETGGLDYYDRHTRRPHYPGEASGITIGVGYDLRFADEADFRELWGPHLEPEVLDELAKDIDRRGTKKRVRELAELGIDVPFRSAWPVFVQQMLPHHSALTEGIYPSLRHLPDLCRSVLVSLVFNRGPALGTKDRRREMVAIRDILERADDDTLFKAKKTMILGEVADQLLAMRRIWPLGSGLIRRRQDEASLWLQGLREW